MTLQTILSTISGGRVLDVATGRGGFILELIAGLKDYTDILGVDSNPALAEAFKQAFSDNPKINFQLMDAGRLEYGDGEFDTVCVSNSLHHFADPSAVLLEMRRVLKPGGNLIVSEMVRDGQSETQMTHVLLHHWWAAVDSSQGIVHNQTYSRAELSALVSTLGLSNMTSREFQETDENPHAAELLAELDGIIDTYIQKADGHPNLQSQGEGLRGRVHTVGFHSASTLALIGIK